MSNEISGWDSVETSVEDTVNPLVVDSGLGDGSTIELIEPLDVLAVSVDGVTKSVLMNNDKVQPRLKSDDLVVLTGNDQMRGEGAWVFDTQGVATEQGFRNVSKLWYPKTLSFEQGMEIVSKQASEREDITTDIRGVQIAVHTGESDYIGIAINDNVYRLGEWAARQFCTWSGVPQTMWTHYHDKPEFRDLELIVEAFKRGIARKYETEKKLLFRTYKDGTLRGVMSDSYSIVDSDWYLNVLKEYIPGGRLSHFNFSDADNFAGNILIPDTIRSEADSEYGGMLNCGNSAIGQRSVWQTPSIFRAICMNGCVWGSKDGVQLKQRHRGIDLEQFKEAIRVNIEKQIPLLTTKIPALISMHDLKLTAPMTYVFAMIAKINNLSSEVLNAACESWLNECDVEKSAFGAYDAFTRAGQKFDRDTWEACDIIGGNLLNAGAEGWEVLNAKAKLMTQKEVNKAFGNDVEE